MGRLDGLVGPLVEELCIHWLETDDIILRNLLISFFIFTIINKFAIPANFFDSKDLIEISYRLFELALDSLEPGLGLVYHFVVIHHLVMARATLALRLCPGQRFHFVLRTLMVLDLNID